MKFKIRVYPRAESAAAGSYSCDVRWNFIGSSGQEYAAKTNLKFTIEFADAATIEDEVAPTVEELEAPLIEIEDEKV